MNIILFDDYSRADLFPLTLTRPIGALRIGILTIAEKWALTSGLPVSYHTEEYLLPKFHMQLADDNILINAKVLPDIQLWASIQALAKDEALGYNNDLLAVRLGRSSLESGSVFIQQATRTPYIENDPIIILHVEDLIKHNAHALLADYHLITAGRLSETLSADNYIIGDNLFVEPGAKCTMATINTSTGPVYIGRDTEIMEGSHIRGPFALMNNSTVKMGSKIYGATTIGPYCTVGGEIKNSVLSGYSNKGHEGYLGDSVLGEWCNLGADTNNSNMKNTYMPVLIYNYRLKERRATGMQFLGMIMGDHSKSGINATFNTGTVIGIGVNFFGTSLSPYFLPDFTWAEPSKFKEYQLEKMLGTARKMMERKNLILNDDEENILREAFKLTAAYRNY